MKSSILKSSLVLAISTIALCSFTKRDLANSKPVINKTNYSDDEEWTKIYNYINTNITTELRKGLPKKNVKTMSFSRCPSGLNTDFTNDEKVSTDEMMYGTINDYVGCRQEYICDFKVCVNKKIALVKSKNDAEYITVQDWLKRKNTKIKS